MIDNQSEFATKDNCDKNCDFLYETKLGYNFF